MLDEGDENGIGKVVSLFAKGWLPYTLRWEFRVTEVLPDGLFDVTLTSDLLSSIVASGD